MKGLFFLLLILQVQAFAGDYEIIPEEMYENQIQTSEDDLINIQSVSYIRNKKASFCTRPTDMIDTIVFHHSETRNNETAEDINEYHLNRGSPTDPWYMIAYSYVLNAPYAGATTPLSKATVGRPLNIVGAHAGSNIFVPMDAVQTKLWEEKKILCGKENETPKYDPSLVKDKKIKANVTTIGVVIIGNYALFSGAGTRRKPNPNPNLNGFIPAKEPTANLIDMYARLSCQLQKKYPRMKNLAYHAKYHSTSCPGTIQKDKHMKAIQTKAKEYGCEFTLMP